MGTTWKATLVTDELTSKSTAPLLQSRLDDLESLFTNWRSDSAVSRFNESQSTDWQDVPRELADVVGFAQNISKETTGAFDITLAPLINLWGFGAGGPVAAAPSETQISQALHACGWSKLEVSVQPPRLRKTQADLQINVSALVEGYALNDLSTLLQKAGIKAFLLEIGGELLARGTKPDGQDWQVGIQQPHGENNTTLQTLPLRDQALSTAGTYRQERKLSGQRISHLLDGRTGRPVVHEIVSVSVLHDSAIMADAWATALLVLGPREGRAKAQELGLNAFFIAESPP